MGFNGNSWPHSITETVIGLWKQTRLSATQIGNRVGKTRNAVLGKLDRLGLLKTTGRIPCVNKQSKARKAARRTSPVRRQPGPRERTAALPHTDVSVAPLNIPLLETLEGQCRYMAGTDGVCCGLPTVPTYSWCENHYRVVFRHGA